MKKDSELLIPYFCCGAKEGKARVAEKRTVRHDDLCCILPLNQDLSLAPPSIVVVVVVVDVVVLTLEKTLCETIAGRPSLDAYL